MAERDENSHGTEEAKHDTSPEILQTSPSLAEGSIIIFNLIILPYTTMSFVLCSRVFDWY